MEEKKGGRKAGVQRGVDGESSYEYLLRRGWYWQGVRTGKNKLQIECDQKELETEKRSNPKLNRQFTKNGGLSIPKRCEEQWRRKVVYAQGGDCLVDNVLLYQLRRPRDHFGCRYVLKKAHSFFLVFFTPPSWRFVVI